MQLSDFYRLAKDFRLGAMRVDDKHPSIRDELAVLVGKENPPCECEFVQVAGSRLVDFIQTDWPVLILISEKVVSLLQSGGFTGWVAHPARIHLKRGGVLDGHHLLVVTGRCGPIDWTKAPLITKPPAVEGGPPYQVRKSLPIGLDEWDGSDLFVPDGCGYIIATKGVRDALLNARVTNVSLINCAEFEILPAGTR